jgi:hypothetical protein
MPRATPKTGAKPAKMSAPSSHTLFLPTLLPAPGAEASPELCWELALPDGRVALRYTQFGWSASVYREGEATIHWRADSLPDLREEVNETAPADLAALLGSPWILAYDTAGL